MLKISDIEKKIIMELHSNYKQKLNEQATQEPQEIKGFVKPDYIANTIVQNKICFCKTASCGGAYKDPKSGDIFINVKMPIASESIDSDGKKRYEAGDDLAFNVNKFIYTVTRTGKSYSWGCQSLTPIITNMRNALQKYYTQLNYKTAESLDYNPDIADTGKFESINLSATHPHLFPKWESINKNDFILYKPKSEDIQPDMPRNQYEERMIEDFKMRYKDLQLKTKKDIMDEREIADFNIVASEYTPFPIGAPGDNKFNRVFNLYYLKGGQEAAKGMYKATKESEKELNINKPTCSKLIKQFYDLYKLGDAAFTKLSEPQIAQLKQQVTYCSRKYNNYGVFNGNKIDQLLNELKGLASTNRFKIK